MRQSDHDLVQFLSGRIMADAGDVKTESAVESVKAILMTDAKLHEDFADEIERVQEVQKSANAQIDAACMYIEDSIRQTLWDEVMYVLLEREAREWVSVGRSLDSHDVQGYLEAQMAQDKIMDAVRRWLPQAETRVKAQYEQMWAEKSEKIGSEFTSSTALIRRNSPPQSPGHRSIVGSRVRPWIQRPTNRESPRLRYIRIGCSRLNRASKPFTAPLLGALFISWAFHLTRYDHLWAPRNTAWRLFAVIQPAPTGLQGRMEIVVPCHVICAEENARRRAEPKQPLSARPSTDGTALMRERWPNARDYAASAEGRR